MVRITYFPQRSEKKDSKYLLNITYQYSDTRPTKNQLSPYQTKEFRLLPITPMPPILKLLAYVPKRSNHNHSIFPCPNYSCIMCRQYETITNINVPVIPCLRYRSTYILYKRNEENIKHAYIGTTNLQKTNICNIGKYNRIKTHLNNRKNIGWQFLGLYSAKDKSPQGEKLGKQIKWKKKIRWKYPKVKIYTTEQLTLFYEICESYSPE